MISALGSGATRLSVFFERVDGFVGIFGLPARLTGGGPVAVSILPVGSDTAVPLGGC
jgi:hypothetical protein